MAVPDWSRDLDRENAALRELVTVYRYLSGLALQDADLAGVVRLISDRTSATVAVLTQLMDVLTAAAPGVSAEKATADVREHLIHPRLGQVLRASRLSQRALRLPKVGGMPAVIVAPVMVGDEVPSYLITIDPADNLFGEDMSLLVTEHAATICGVILGRERVVAAAARRVRDDLGAVVRGLDVAGVGRDHAQARPGQPDRGQRGRRPAAGTTPTPAGGPRTWVTIRPGTTRWWRSRSSCPPGRSTTGPPPRELRIPETARRCGSGSGRASSTS